MWYPKAYAAEWGDIMKVKHLARVANVLDRAYDAQTHLPRNDDDEPDKDHGIIRLSLDWMHWWSCVGAPTASSSVKRGLMGGFLR